MPKGPYFADNVKRLREKDTGDNKRRSEESNRSRSHNLTTNFQLDSAKEKGNGFFEIDQMQVKLIPRDWKLSDEQNPQIWQFAWADDDIIIRAHNDLYDHGQFRYSIGEPNLDTHTLFNSGMIENLDGLQRFMNWLFNSHVDNIRRTINNAALYSPRFIEEDDLLNPGPAGHMRFTEEGEDLILRGIPVSNFFRQATMQDVTGVHLNTTNAMFQMGKEMMAVNEPAMGQITETKRTLGELQRVIFSQERRIGLTAKLLDMLVVKPMAMRSISNRQQFTKLRQYYEIVGENAKRYGIPPQMLGKEHILGNYDYIPNTGTIPPDPTRFAETWSQALIAVSKTPPQYLMKPDGRVFQVSEMLDEFMRALGIDDIEHFYRAGPQQVTVLPDEQVQAGVQAGNLLPAPEAMNPMGVRNAA